MKNKTQPDEDEPEPTEPSPENPPNPPLPGLPEPQLSEKTVKELDFGKEKEALKKIEAALFISGKYMSIQELINLTSINPLFLKELLNKLIEQYKTPDSAIEIIEKNQEYKMDVNQEHVDMINKLATGNSEFKKSEQETLAIIAYKQPIKQSVLIKIRGNKAYDHVKKFAQLNLIKAKKAGRTKELTLSPEFYDYFNLEDKKGKQEVIKLNNQKTS